MLHADSPVVAKAGRAHVSWMSTAVAIILAAYLAPATAAVQARTVPPDSAVDADESSAPAGALVYREPINSPVISSYDPLATDVDFRSEIPADPGLNATEVERPDADRDSSGVDFFNGTRFAQVDAKTFERPGTGGSPNDSGDSAAVLSGITIPAESSPPAIPLPPAIVPGLSGLALAAGFCYRFRRHPVR